MPDVRGGLAGALLVVESEAVVEKGERWLLELECGCGRAWHVTSSLDERILGRFVTHGGPRADGKYPA